MKYMYYILYTLTYMYKMNNNENILEYVLPYYCLIFRVTIVCIMLHILLKVEPN